MTILIPKIDANQLSKTDFDRFNNLNSKQYGLCLATKVADKLSTQKNKKDLYFYHRDYCGLGIFYTDEKFILSTVFDGFPTHEVIAEFIEKSVFTDWLAIESDQSMSLYGTKFNNQTITKMRLNWFLEDNYSPVWNNFCQYAQKASSTDF